MRSGRVASRRRRVVLEESQQSQGSEKRTRTLRGEDSAPTRTYSVQAEAERQPRITDCIPTRRLTLVLLLGLMVVTAVALHALDLAARVYGQSGKGWQILSNQAGGTLAGWTSAMVLFAGAIYATLIYFIQRHKVDDYRGHYRLWLWVAACFTFASVMQVANVAPLLTDLLRQLAWLPANLIRPVVTCTAAVLGLLAATRLGFEVRASLLALTTTILAVVCGLVALSLPYVSLPASPLVVEQTLAGLWLATSMGSVVACLSFARYVYLDSQGLIENAVETRQERKRDPVAEEVDSKEEAKPEKPPKASQKASKEKPAKKKPDEKRPAIKLAKVEDDAHDSEEFDPHELLESESQPAKKLSKSERRKLRKQRRRAA